MHLLVEVSQTSKRSLEALLSPTSPWIRIPEASLSSYLFLYLSLDWSKKYHNHDQAWKDAPSPYGWNLVPRASCVWNKRRRCLRLTTSIDLCIVQLVWNRCTVLKFVCGILIAIRYEVDRYLVQVSVPKSCSQVRWSSLQFQKVVKSGLWFGLSLGPDGHQQSFSAKTWELRPESVWVSGSS